MFTQRSALILLLGTLAGSVVAILTVRTGSGPDAAMLDGGGAFAGAVIFFNATIS
ncbi:hypothetical protein NX794_03635 [Streptomyces sp. LP11]|uniref:Uncharacterized protein n=1 Tax=Streptomyces pyxinicus TaxID=2970331 RepID=A0ABT2AVP7_9ACTN|nr:hypothetical protein [Streptomyces sp. LP11]MCS0600325.1 hypothetical protein [Streptomyces sp. LP11]